jgi:hypothetical protein
VHGMRIAVRSFLVSEYISTMAQQPLIGIKG